MKLRIAIILTTLAIALSACNMTLAADITPPPGYVPPTPGPTLGPIFPAQAPSIENGAAIYAEKCAPCHGNTGLGDGAKGKELPVTVAAFALPETAHKAAPARWYTTVTQGKIDRYMPPFASLNDQQKWDVVSYALTLHTTPQQIETGKGLFEAKCKICHAEGFTQEKLAALSAENIAYLIANGKDKMPATTMTEDEAYAVAAYVRSLTFASLPIPTVTAVPVTPTSASAASETPSAVVTPLDGTPQSEVTPEASAQVVVTSEAGTQVAVTSKGTPAIPTGTISGSAKGAAKLSAGLPVTLRGYDHTGDQTSGPQETLTLTGALNADGTFKFENVEIPTGRIFLVEIEYNGIQYQSDFEPIEAGKSELVLPPITVYETSTDLSLLTFQQVHLYSDFANQGVVQIVEIYTFVNSSDKTVNIVTDGKSIPFITLPDNATDVGFEAGQDSAPFMGSTEGVAILPNEKPYSVIAFFNVTYDTKALEIKQKFVLDTPSVLLLFPEGIKVDSAQLTPAGSQTIQDGTFETFNASGFKAGDTLTFSFSGTPKVATGATPTTTKNNSLLIGVGSFGLVLILAGIWLFMRDRKRGNIEIVEEEQAEFEEPESVMDAIIALDDLHRAGKIPDEAYHARRDELKAKLKKEI
jgi:mono/diheme cytochrome c family protein